MLAKSLITVALFAGVLVAAGPNDAIIFSVRSYLHPNTQAKISLSDLLSAGPAHLTVQIAAVLKTDNRCSIPLLEFKAPPANDSIGKPFRPTADRMTVPPPLPACKN